MNDEEQAAPPASHLLSPTAELPSVIVEVGGRVEVISGGGEVMALPPTVEHPGGAGRAGGAGEVVSENDDDTHTPFSADLSLDTPKSYMSATGAEADLNGGSGCRVSAFARLHPVSHCSSQARASSSRALTRHSRTPQLLHTRCEAEAATQAKSRDTDADELTGQEQVTWHLCIVTLCFETLSSAAATCVCHRC